MQIGKNKDRMPVLISDRIDFKYCYKRQKKKQLHNDQGLNPARSLTIIVIYAFDMNIISSVHSVMSDSLQPHESQHTRPPCPSPTPRVHSNSHPSRWWCHPAISFSVIPVCSQLQSFPASESFPVSQFFLSGGQSIGVSVSASVIPMNIQDCFSLGWTGWISLQSKGLSRVFSNMTVQKHQFFGTQLSL